MANALTAGSPKYWSANAQIKFFVSTIYKEITTGKEKRKDGRQFDQPYTNDVLPDKYVKGTAQTAQDLQFNADVLTVDQFNAPLIYVDDVDKIQNKYDAMALWSQELGRRMAGVLDADLLYEAVNATTTIDAGNVGGTDDEGIALTSANVSDIFGEINEALDNQNVPMDDRYVVLSPLAAKKFWAAVANRDTSLGDDAARNGIIAKYDGIKVFKSNNLTGEAVWTPADDPSNAATITIDSVVFTFVSSIGSTAGNILISGTVAGTIDNLVALINNGGATSDSGVSNVSLSDANQKKVQQWVAVDGATKITVRAKGTPNLTVASSESADTWDAKWNNQNLIAGRKRAIDVVVQTDPVIQFETDKTISAGKRGMNIMPLLVYGKKVYNNRKDELIWLKIRKDS